MRSISPRCEPVVIDYDDKEFPQTGEKLSDIDYEAFVARRRSGFRLGDTGR